MKFIVFCTIGFFVCGLALSHPSEDVGSLAVNPAGRPTSESPTTTTNSTITTTTSSSNTTVTTSAPTTTKVTTPPPSNVTSTIPTTSTASTPVTTTNSTTTAKPTAPPTPQPGRKFDLPSFIGGFVLAAGLVAIGMISWKFYVSRQENYYHTL